MLAILLTTFPFFALVLCGYAAVSGRLLPIAAIPGLNIFVLYFALPCLLYRFGADTALAQLLDPLVVAIYLACAALMVAIATSFSRRQGSDWNNAAFGALVAAFPNTGYMGVPLLVALLGPPAAGTAILTILVDLIFTTSVCVAMSRLAAAGTDGARTAARGALRSVAINPLPWSIIAGAAASAIGITFVAPLMHTVSLLADAASPVALFTIGAVLARSRATSSARTPLRDYVPLALAKLVVHPLLVFAVCRVLQYAGVPLDPRAITVLVLVAALPSASNVSVLAERFEADNGRIARIILLSTALAFLTFSAAVALLAK
ncbi:MAG: AEC family transporter [Pseudomonadota bacterium]|nr:AEC family transporter [Pseudomonadota bacterium]